MALKNLGIFIVIATILAQAISVPAEDDAPLEASAPGCTHQEYIVGDCKGWTENFDYIAWVNGKEFYMGDKLVFNYEKGKHNVVKVDEPAVNLCCAPPENEVLSCGHDVVTLSAMGGVGFMSSIGDDCKNGMKLFIPDVKCPNLRPKA